MPWNWFWSSESSTAPATTLPTSPTLPPAIALASSPLSSASNTPTGLSTEAHEDAYTPLPESTRLRRQLTLCVAGPLFLSLSIIATKRATRRRHLAVRPPLFLSNQAPPLVPPSGAHDAAEALYLATLNTSAFAMTLIGGAMFALDVVNVEELRRRVRGDDGLGTNGLLPEAYAEMKRAEKQAEEEMEEWMVSVLARKEVREKAKKLAENMEKEGQ